MSVRFASSLRALALLLAVVAAVPAIHSPADARAGGGMSFGSRGARSFSMPSPTAVAPRPAQPFSQNNAAPAARPRGFGFGTGLLAGLLGASLFGGGLLGGLGGLLSGLFHLALIGGAIWLVLRLVRGRAARPAAAGAPFASAAYSPLPGAPSGANPQPLNPDSIRPEDYAAFEASLTAVQDAFNREDVAAIERLATPAVAGELANELQANRQRGVHNEVTGTRLLAGDLSEAWQEGSSTYATVAMRFSTVDVLRERGSGRVVAGDPTTPTVATELWTFVRSGMGAWRLSAIQQAG